MGLLEGLEVEVERGGFLDLLEGTVSKLFFSLTFWSQWEASSVPRW